MLLFNFIFSFTNYIGSQLESSQLEYKTSGPVLKGLVSRHKMMWSSEKCDYYSNRRNIIHNNNDGQYTLCPNMMMQMYTLLANIKYQLCAIANEHYCEKFQRITLDVVNWFSTLFGVNVMFNVFSTNHHLFLLIEDIFLLEVKMS
jgi:hypothetical protein